MRSVGLLLAAVVALALPTAAAGATPRATAAAPGPSRVATATPRDGVRMIGDLRVGPLGGPGVVSTLAEVRAVWGRELRLKHVAREACEASWGTGVRLTFTTFGEPGPCAERPLQAANLIGPRWKVRVGDKRYAIGAPRSSLPAGARLIPGLDGYQLATMPFAGGRTPTVIAHIRDDRIDRFWLYIGGAGD